MLLLQSEPTLLAPPPLERSPERLTAGNFRLFSVFPLAGSLWYPKFRTVVQYSTPLRGSGILVDPAELLVLIEEIDAVVG